MNNGLQKVSKKRIKADTFMIKQSAVIITLITSLLSTIIIYTNYYKFFSFIINNIKVVKPRVGEMSLELNKKVVICHETLLRAADGFYNFKSVIFRRTEMCERYSN